ncbi:MAG: hypothetical protein M1118_03825 [Chloroflexi bacterium]|nr:hypothetical protein [Chloroflexota bacterium]
MRVDQLHTDNQSARGLLLLLRADVARLVDRTASQIRRVELGAADRRRMEITLESLQTALATVEEQLGSASGEDA